MKSGGDLKAKKLGGGYGEDTPPPRQSSEGFSKPGPQVASGPAAPADEYVGPRNVSPWRNFMRGFGSLFKGLFVSPPSKSPPPLQVTATGWNLSIAKSGAHLRWKTDGNTLTVTGSLHDVAAFMDLVRSEETDDSQNVRWDSRRPPVITVRKIREIAAGTRAQINFTVQEYDGTADRVRVVMAPQYRATSIPWGKHIAAFQEATERTIEEPVEGKGVRGPTLADMRAAFGRAVKAAGQPATAFDGLFGTDRPEGLIESYLGAALSATVGLRFVAIDTDPPKYQSMNRFSAFVIRLWYLVGFNGDHPRVVTRELVGTPSENGKTISWTISEGGAVPDRYISMVTDLFAGGIRHVSEAPGDEEVVPVPTSGSPEVESIEVPPITAARSERFSWKGPGLSKTDFNRDPSTAALRAALSSPENRGLISSALRSGANFYIVGLITPSSQLIIARGITLREAKDKVVATLGDAGFSKEKALILIRDGFYMFFPHELREHISVQRGVRYSPPGSYDEPVTGDVTTIPMTVEGFDDERGPATRRLSPGEPVDMVSTFEENEPTPVEERPSFLHASGVVPPQKNVVSVVHDGQATDLEIVPGTALYSGDGQLASAVLGGLATQTINGVTFRHGTTVGFNQRGMLETAFHVKASETQGVNYENAADDDDNAVDVSFGENGEVTKVTKSWPGGTTPVSPSEGSAPSAPPVAEGNPGAAPPAPDGSASAASHDGAAGFMTSSSRPVSFGGFDDSQMTPTGRAADTSNATGADGTYTGDPMSLMFGQGSSSTFDATLVGTDLLFQPGMMMPAPAGAALVGR